MLEALSGRRLLHPDVLDLPIGEGGSAVLSDTLMHEDTAIDEAEARVMLMPAISRCPSASARSSSSASSSR